MLCNHIYTVFLNLTLVTLFCFGCTGAQQDSNIHDTIVAANQKWMAAVEQGDAAGMAALYTRNAQLLPTNSDFVSGSEAIQTFWQGVMDMGIKQAHLETVEAEGMGNTAYEVGKYTLYADEGQIVDHGKYVVIWKQEDGQWKLHTDIWNTSAAPPAMTEK